MASISILGQGLKSVCVYVKHMFCKIYFEFMLLHKVNKLIVWAKIIFRENWSGEKLTAANHTYGCYNKQPLIFLCFAF